jgi:hypothetical protein
MSLTTSMEVSVYVVSENVGGKVVVSVKVNTLGQSLKGIQLKLNYDKDILKYENMEYITDGNPTNFSNDTGNYINFGSLIYSGNGLLNDTTEYKITFLPKIGIEGTLGLTSISATDAVNKDGKQLKINLN